MNTWATVRPTRSRSATQRLPRSPVAKRISPDEARTLIEHAVVGRLKILSITPADCRAALRQVAARGFRSGAVYDALHAQCARKAGVDQLLTCNLADFERFDLEGIAVAAP